MAQEFKLPELGENVASGDLVRVMVKPGDTVSEGQPVIELETDKAVIEVPSSVSGKVQEVKVQQGQKLKVGTTIFTYGDGNGSAPQPAAPQKKEEKPKVEAKIEPSTQSEKNVGKQSGAPSSSAGQGGAPDSLPTFFSDCVVGSVLASTFGFSSFFCGAAGWGAEPLPSP